MTDRVTERFIAFLFNIFPYGQLTEPKLQFLRDYYKFVEATLAPEEDLRSR